MKENEEKYVEVIHPSPTEEILKNKEKYPDLFSPGVTVIDGKPEPIPYINPLIGGYMNYVQNPFKKKGNHLTPPKKKRKKNTNRRNR